MEAQKHSFSPEATPDAELLFLGSLPSDESLRKNQYYGNPHNAFWKIMGELFGFSSNLPYNERLHQLSQNRVALWDVVGTATRPGSLDASISNYTPNDIPELLNHCPKLRAIGCNGSTAYRLLKRHHPELFERPDLDVVALPSTSPAAAGIRYSDKLAAFRKMLKYMGTRE